MIESDEQGNIADALKLGTRQRSHSLISRPNKLLIALLLRLFACFVAFVLLALYAQQPN